MYRKPRVSLIKTRVLLHIFVLTLSLLFVATAIAKDSKGSSKPPRGWKITDQASGIVQYDLRCKTKTRSRMPCPEVTVKREAVSETRRKSYLDQIVVKYLDETYAKSRKDVDFDILRLGETHLVKVSSRLGSRQFVTIIAVDDNYIRVYELGAEKQIFNQYDKDFYSYWRQDLSSKPTSVLVRAKN